ncbi:MAG: DUF262 domain-containing protein [Pseudomonadota bacterium]
MQISSTTHSLGEALALGTFTPAPVQREYQWTPREAGQMLADIFDCFVRLGLDPDDGRDAAEASEDDARARDDRADVDRDALAAYETRIARDRRRSVPAVNPLPRGASGKANGVIDQAGPQPKQDPSARLKPREGGRGQQPPAPIYNLNAVVLFAGDANRRFEVYDGVQRLTTLSLMLAKLRDAGDLADDDLRDVVDDFLFVDETRKARRILHPTAGRTLYHIAEGHRVMLRDNVAEGDRAMRIVADHFERSLAAWSLDRRKAFVVFLMTRVVITVQVLSDRSLAYQTFLTTNKRGLQLKVGDILKGEIVENANLANATAEQIREIERAWRSAQRDLREGFEDFVIAIERLMFEDAGRAAATGEHLLAFLNAQGSADRLLAWVTGEFAERAALFQVSRRHMAAGYHGTSGGDLRFRQLSFLGWKDWQPVFLRLAELHGGALTGAAWQAKLDALVHAAFTMEILGWQRGRERRFADALGQIEQGLNPFAGETVTGSAGALFLDTGTLRYAHEQLMRPMRDADQRRAVMLWLETLSWPEPVPLECTANVTIEHIMPAVLHQDWLPALQLYLPHGSRDELIELHDATADLIGNLCVLDVRTQKTVGAASWPQKVAAYESWRRRFQTVDSVLHVGSDAWGRTEIDLRTAYLARQAAEQLGLPPI